MRLRLAPFALPILLSAALNACDGELIGLADVSLATDTVVLAVPAPGAAIGSAVDFVRDNAVVLPESLADAQLWDVALRRSAGGLSLLPRPGGFFPGGIVQEGARIARVSGQTFDQLEEAPTTRAAYGDTAVALVVGAPYIARSRTFVDGQQICFRYSKLEPLEANVAAGTARLHVVTSRICRDQRLAADD